MKITKSITAAFTFLALMLLKLPAHEGTHSGGDDMPALTNHVRISEGAQYREFQVDSLPDHSHGRFPNPGNPHEITPQAETYRIPLNPIALDSPRPVGMGAFGLALNGILFEPAAAEFWQNDRRSGWQYEALGHHLDLGEDVNHAHVQASGKYHYHGVPTGLVKNLGASASTSPTLLGYAADGYPVYSYWSYSEAHDSSSPLVALKSSYRLKSGSRPDGPGAKFDGTYVQDYEYVEGLGDLDLANGRFGVTPEYPDGTYYYVITSSFPYIPRYWHGQPGPDFARGPGANQAPAGGAPPRTRPPGRGTGAPAHPVLSLLRNESFLTSLTLSSAQSRELHRELSQVERSTRNSRPQSSVANPDDRRAQRLALIANIEPQIASLRARALTNAQNLIVDQRLRRDQGPNLLLADTTRHALNLSDSQFAEIYQSIVNSRAAYSIPLTWAELADFLDPSQRAQLAKLIGSFD